MTLFGVMVVFLMVLLSTAGAVAAHPATVAGFAFYSPVNYQAGSADYASYLHKYAPLHDDEESNPPDYLLYSFGPEAAGTGADGYQFDGLTTFVEDEQVYLLASLNWHQGLAGDGTSAIRLYRDTGSQIEFVSQLYSESSWGSDPGGPGAGDREFYGLARVNLDGDEYQDLLVSVNYVNEYNYLMWFEDDGTGSYHIVGSIKAWSDEHWHIYGLTARSLTGRPVGELLVCADYEGPSGKSYLQHYQLVDNLDGTFSAQLLSSLYLDRDSPGAPVFFGVQVLRSLDRAQLTDLILGIAYRQAGQAGQEQYARLRVDLKALDRAGTVDAGDPDAEALWWQLPVLLDPAQDSSGAERDWQGLSAVYRADALVFGCEQTWFCGSGLAADLNRDCRVNLSDFAQLTAQWLTCVDPADAACEPD